MDDEADAPAEPIKSEAMMRLERMDKAADALMKSIENPETSDTQRGRLFAQLLSYEKLRPSLLPKDDGNKLQEMTDELSTGSKRGGSAGRAKRERDGKDIEALIRRLPRSRPNHVANASAANRGAAHGNPPNPQRASGSDAGDDRSLRTHSGGNGASESNGASGRSDL